MTIYAWVEKGVIRDLSKELPEKVFTLDVAQLFSQEVPDNANVGDSWDGKKLSAKAVPTAPATLPPVIQPPIIPTSDFFFLFTQAERVAIEGSKDSTVTATFARLAASISPQIDLAKPYIGALLTKLEAVSILSPERVTEILSGTFPESL